MYISHFGFNEKPFNVTPNPRFFYTNPGYQEAYANLLYGIRERKGFLVLTGEVGTGKTTLLRRLMENLESTVRFVFFYNTTLSFEELLTFVCEELGLPVRGDGRLEKIKALNEFLIEQLKRGSTGVLFIDEAQNLSETVFESLRLLSNLETSNEKLLQIVLAGQPELQKKLDQPELRQLKQRIFLQWRLEPLREEEVGAFIDYRLKAVGCRRSDLFPRDAVREVALYSKGIPRLINIICDNALLIAYADSAKKVSADIIREVARDLRLATTVEPPRAKAVTFKTLFNHRERNGDHPAIFRPEPVSSAAAILPDVEPKNGAAPVARMEPVPAKSPAPARTPAPKSEAPIRTQAPTKSGAPEKTPAPEKPQAPKSETSPVSQAFARSPAPVKSPARDVSKLFLDMLTRALTEAMGPMAPLVIQDQLAALRNSSATLQKANLERLVELVSREILDDLLKIGFQKRMSVAIEALSDKESDALKETP